MLTGNVFITGGAGYLGRSIIARARQEGWPAKFTIYSRDETKQWEVQHRFPGVRCILGDVSHDLERLAAAMAGHDLVIHAGAVKYIPEAEWNVFETIQTNVQGSINIALAARSAGVEKVIGISTDKACAPLNTYGMTKALMERIFAEANRRGGTMFGTVRYGNVVGSTGSVIPVFLKQLDESGRIKITDDRMTRFWLAPREAIDLVLHCAEEIEHVPGITLVGANPAMRIVDLAQATFSVWLREGSNAQKAGIANGERIPPAPIDLIGIRPGEKLHESLFNEQEAPRAYRYRQRGPDYGRVWDDSKPEPVLGYAIVPPTATIPDGAEAAPALGYSSDNPTRWLDIEEMANLIVETRSI